MKSSRNRVPRLFLGLLLAGTTSTLSLVEAPTASLRIFWRFAVLSFDHPATQLLDEVASAYSAGSSSVGTEAHRFARLTPAGRFVPASDPGRVVASVLGSGITRAPPAA